MNTGGGWSMGDPRVGAVMITWNRREEALTSVGRLVALPERPHVVLVDPGFPGPRWAASWPGRRCCGGMRSWSAGASTGGCGWAARRSCRPWTWPRPDGSLCYLGALTVHHQASRSRDALRGLPWVPAERRPVPPRVEARLVSLEASQARSRARRYVS